MGFNFGDLLTVAEGAIERDRFHTDADLKIRGELLVADKNAYIQRKNKKYDSELKAFEIEKEKVNRIKSLNATMPIDGTGNAHDYAVKYNMIVYPGFASLDGKLQRQFVNSTKNLIEGPEGTGTLNYISTAEKNKDYLESEINTLSSQASKIYADKLVNARGNSFLINKITRTEPKSLAVNDKEINEAVETQMKALNLAKDVEHLSAEEMGVGKKLKGTVYTKTDEGYDFWTSATTEERTDFETKFLSAMNQVTWKGVDNQDSVNTVVNIINSVGGNTAAFVTEKQTNKGKILALKEPGKAIANWIEQAFQEERTKFSVKTAYNFLKNNHSGGAVGNIYHIASEAAIYEKIRQAASERDFYLEGDWLGFIKDLSGTKLKAEGVTILPLGIINLDNKLQTIKDGNAATITLNRDEIKQLSSAYGKLFKTEDGYEQVLSIFKKYGEINETMFKKYLNNPNAGLAFISKELNHPNAINTNVGQIIWMTLAQELGEERIGSELWNMIENAKSAKKEGEEQKIIKKFTPTIVEVADPDGNLVSGVRYFSTKQKKWKTITKKTWDNISKEKREEIKSQFPDVYTLLITLE